MPFGLILGAIGTVAQFSQGRKQARQQAANAKEAKENADKAAWDRILEAETQFALDERDRWVTQELAYQDRDRINMQIEFATQNYGLNDQRLQFQLNEALNEIRESRGEARASAVQKLANLGLRVEDIEAATGNRIEDLDFQRDDIGFQIKDLLAATGNRIEDLGFQRDDLGFQRDDFLASTGYRIEDLGFQAQEADAALGAQLQDLGFQQEEAEARANQAKIAARQRRRAKLNDFYRRSGGGRMSRLAARSNIESLANEERIGIDRTLDRATSKISALGARAQEQHQRTMDRLEALEGRALDEQGRRLGQFDSRFGRIDSLEGRALDEQGRRLDQFDSSLGRLDALEGRALDEQGRRLNEIGLERHFVNENLARLESRYDRRMGSAAGQYSLNMKSAMAGYLQNMTQLDYNRQTLEWQAQVNDETKYMQNIENYRGGIINARQISEGGARIANQFNQQASLSRMNANAGLLNNLTGLYSNYQALQQSAPQGLL